MPCLWQGVSISLNREEDHREIWMEMMIGDEIVLKLKTFGGKAILSGTRSWLESSRF